MSFYADLQGVAAGVLRQFGQGAIYHVQRTAGTGPAYNPGTPTETRTLIRGAVAAGAKASYVAQGLAITGDLQVTTEVVAGITVAMGDVIEIDGTPYRVVNIVAVPAAGTPVVYVYIVRR